jgi:hypothetical protein
VWKTIPHPSQERFQAGGPNGFLDLFIKEPSYAKQWRYTGAPDADARAIQAALWAARWAREQGKTLPLEGAARMGDSLRYALQDKYFKSRHGLLSWSQAWGGSLDAATPWAWRAGSSHVHAGYQNPVAAWALVNDPALAPKSPGAARDWTESLRRQLDFYRWLQSAEGAIAGGADAGPDGLTYVEHPVFLDPPSNDGPPRGIRAARE